MILEIFAYISVGIIAVAYLIVLVNDLVQKIIKSKNVKLEAKEDS